MLISFLGYSIYPLGRCGYPGTVHTAWTGRRPSHRVSHNRLYTVPCARRPFRRDCIYSLEIWWLGLLFRLFQQRRWGRIFAYDTCLWGSIHVRIGSQPKPVWPLSLSRLLANLITPEFFIWRYCSFLASRLKWSGKTPRHRKLFTSRVPACKIRDHLRRRTNIAIHCQTSLVKCRRPGRCRIQRCTGHHI